MRRVEDYENLDLMSYDPRFNMHMYYKPEHWDSVKEIESSLNTIREHLKRVEIPVQFHSVKSYMGKGCELWIELPLQVYELLKAEAVNDTRIEVEVDNILFLGFSILPVIKPPYLSGAVAAVLIERMHELVIEGQELKEQSVEFKELDAFYMDCFNYKSRIPHGDIVVRFLPNTAMMMHPTLMRNTPFNAKGLS